MSTTIVAVVLNLLATVLPWLGITVGSDQLTTTVQTLVLVGSGIWIWYRRVGVGDVNALGVKK